MKKPWSNQTSCPRRYKSHDTISIPIRFIRNNVREDTHHKYHIYYTCIYWYGLTLWRHCCQEASTILGSKTPLRRKFGNQKNAKKIRKCSLRCAVTFWKFPQKTLFTWFDQWINSELIRGQRYWEVVFFTDIDGSERRRCADGTNNDMI